MCSICTFLDKQIPHPVWENRYIICSRPICPLQLYALVRYMRELLWERVGRWMERAIKSTSGFVVCYVFVLLYLVDSVLYYTYRGLLSVPSMINAERCLIQIFS